VAFKDLFSGYAADYARYRPSYPAQLFAWLAAESPAPELAVDLGTGSGQAAIGLAAHFDRVFGLDPSVEQIDHARSHPNVEYRVAPAEETGLAASSVDLLLAAQSFHWFRAEPFFAEARRVLRSGGVLALVTYELSQISPEVDAVIDELYRSLDAYWEPERRRVMDRYASVDVPFPEIAAPAFEMHSRWTMAELLGYLGTWSALRRRMDETGVNPLEAAAPGLATAWGTAAARDVRWPLTVRAFRLP
jgi:SAM-dependent methyltransferase